MLPNSVAAAATGAAASPSAFVGVASAMATLDSIGPGLATLAMPPEFE